MFLNYIDLIYILKLVVVQMKSVPFCALFCSNVSECFEVPWIQKSHLLMFSLSLSLSIFLSLWVWEREVCARVGDLLTPKQMIADTLNLAFYIYIIYRCFSKFFMKIEQKICMQGHTKETQKLYGLLTEFLVSEFYST